MQSSFNVRHVGVQAGRLGVGICYDMRFPELAWIYAQQVCDTFGMGFLVILPGEEDGSWQGVTDGHATHGCQDTESAVLVQGCQLLVYPGGN